MDATKLLVTLAGFGAIVWLNRYFFRGAPRTHTRRPEAESEDLTIVVDGGYSPATIEVPLGKPVRLHFERRDSGACTDEVVFGDFGIRRFLPAGQTTTVEFTPSRAGTYQFACGMGMVRGKVIVQG
jgi:plastocyanin domain-containing protein